MSPKVDMLLKVETPYRVKKESSPKKLPWKEAFAVVERVPPILVDTPIKSPTPRFFSTYRTSADVTKDRVGST
jgi:hypothetical protein